MNPTTEQKLVEIQQWVNARKRKNITTNPVAKELLQRRNTMLEEIQQMLNVIQSKSNEEPSRQTNRGQAVINEYLRLRTEIIHIETIIGD